MVEPKQNLYAEFTRELREQFKDFGYNWTKSKELACDWVLRRVPEGRGVDVGGTEYMVRKCQEMGRDITYFDYFPPRAAGIEKVVTADMAKFGNYFAERSLDFITTRHTLEHSLNPLFQLWQYNRCLKDDGVMVVVVPHHSKNWVWFYSHFNCIPLENWLMLFYRAGFRVQEINAGTWWSEDPDYIEYRLVLRVESRALRLSNPDS